MRDLLLHIFLSTSLLSHSQEMDGKILYTMHCSACHQLKIEQGGPALTEIAKLYLGKPGAFKKWVHAPQPHKRKHLAQMPAMTHVPDQDLQKIYIYIMQLTKNVKTEAPKKNIDRFPEQLKRRPMVQRIFLKDVGPAAIAVALQENYSYAFDAGECRFRHLWKGDFLDGYPYWRGNGDGLAKLKGDIILQEKLSPLSNLMKGANKKFLGYRIQNGLPTFNYRIGQISVTERIISIKTGIRRTFTLQGAPPEIMLTFPEVPGLSYSSPGNWQGATLTTDSKRPIVIDYKFHTP